MRLRTWFSANGVKPSRDLDDLGSSLLCGSLNRVKEDFTKRIDRLLHSGQTLDNSAARKSAAEELYNLRWGPTKIPIYNVILAGTILAPWYHSEQIELTRWLIQDAEVPVDGKDLSGAETIHHALACTPTLELEFAQLLYDAGGDVNQRDRNGYTAMHEVTQIYDGRSAIAVSRHKAALQWYLAHGGNIDIRENEGKSARDLIKHSWDFWSVAGDRSAMLDLMAVVKGEDMRRARLSEVCCSFCGQVPEGPISLMICSQCKSARYCSAPRRCQAGDWPNHKASCREKVRRMTLPEAR